MVRVPMPFFYPDKMQAECEQRFEKDLRLMLQKTYTVLGATGEVCLLDQIPLPFKHFEQQTDFLEWTQTSLRTLQFTLGYLLRMASVMATTPAPGTATATASSTKEQDCPEKRAAKLWYTQFARLDKAEEYTQQMRVQIQTYILQFPGFVSDHVSHFPHLSFEDKLELMCSLCFSACKIFLATLWNPKAVPQCPSMDPMTMARFHATWQQPLYKKLLTKVDENSFCIRMMDAYQKPIARLMDHYQYFLLLDEAQFCI